MTDLDALVESIVWNLARFWGYNDDETKDAQRNILAPLVERAEAAEGLALATEVALRKMRAQLNVALDENQELRERAQADGDHCVHYWDRRPMGGVCVKCGATR